MTELMMVVEKFGALTMMLFLLLAMMKGWIVTGREYTHARNVERESWRQLGIVEDAPQADSWAPSREVYVTDDDPQP